MPFKVVKVNHSFKNVVISHKVLIEEDIEKQKSDILSKLEKGRARRANPTSACLPISTASAAGRSAAFGVLSGSDFERSLHRNANQPRFRAPAL
jgi:hypothetical protein